MPHTLPIPRDTVKQYLPHRDPMLFVDRVIALSENVITIESDIREDAEYFRGHFPNLPILPGVLIVETAAQAGALLVALSKGLDENKILAFASVEEAKFRRSVHPGATLVVDVTIEKIRLPLYKFSGNAKVAGKTVASLKFAAAQMDYSQEK